MKINIVNNSTLSQLEVQQAISAINFQLARFGYEWSILAQCTLVGSRGKTISMKELRGEAILYLFNVPKNKPSDNALGWHDMDRYGVAHGIVYTDYYDEPWTVTLSHEVLEIVLNPHVNRLCMAKHPTKSHNVYYWYEACDPVQAQTYKLFGVEVSDYVLPMYFTPAEEPGMLLSYTGIHPDLKSFGVAPGGYAGFYDPVLGHDDAYFNATDPELEAKARKMYSMKRGRHGSRIARMAALKPGKKWGSKPTVKVTRKTSRSRATSATSTGAKRGGRTG